MEQKIDKLTKEEIYNLADEQLQCLIDKVGGDAFCVDQLIRHINFIYATKVIFEGTC